MLWVRSTVPRIYIRLMQLEHMGLIHSEHYATALINAGDVYVNSRELPEALQYFLRARDLLVECGLAGDYRMAALNNNISMVYRDTGEFDKAEQALDIAFRIIRGIPECRGELATTYINLGELQVRQNKLEMARESFEEACRMFEEDGGGDVHYSSACAGLGQVYYLKGQIPQAIRWYEKALTLMERDFGRPMGLPWRRYVPCLPTCISHNSSTGTRLRNRPLSQKAV